MIKEYIGLGTAGSAAAYGAIASIENAYNSGAHAMSALGACDVANSISTSPTLQFTLMTAGAAVPMTLLYLHRRNQY